MGGGGGRGPGCWGGGGKKKEGGPPPPPQRFCLLSFLGIERTLWPSGQLLGTLINLDNLIYVI